MGTSFVVTTLLRNWKPVVIILALLFFIPLILVFAPFVQNESTPEAPEGGIGGQAEVSESVRRYEPVISEYAAKYGVEGYVEILLAKMMQESGGRGGDPMQSSESLGFPPNTITNPITSIDVGVRYFAGIIKETKGDVKLALQSYNFGGGFIPYANKRGGYSKETAVAFSNMMAKKLGWSRYGDVNYVDNVLRYFKGDVNNAEPVNSYGWIKPIKGAITSHFGFRIHPIFGVPKLHGGTDFSCGQKPVPIYAAKSGKVTKAGWQNPSNHKAGFGQRVYINHGSGQETIYAHLSKMLVKPGQEVKQGQQIGNCGTTGSSTGMHLHFELVANGQKVDPKGRVF